MSKHSCCVVNCKNTGINSQCHFYRFRTPSWKLEKRLKWIVAVRRTNHNGSLRFPKPTDRICSAHFVSGKKSEEQLSPSYIPTIFPSIYKTQKKDESAAIKRHERYEKRKERSLAVLNFARENSLLLESMEYSDGQEYENNLNDPPSYEKQYSDQACQAETFLNDSEPSKTFVCNRFISNFSCDAEVQTDIRQSVRLVTIPNKKKTVGKGCNTNNTSTKDKYTETDFKSDVPQKKYFEGFSSVHNDQEMRDLAGVTLDNFQFLLKRTFSASEHCKISQEDRLLIFLMKIKSGLTFSSLAVLFGIHRTTIGIVFESILSQLAYATSDLVFWPSKDVVQGTMPECFIPDHEKTRVIIDCTEFRTEIPKSIENRIWCYSQYKGGFTAKVLIGITPNGFISFKSKVAGGRKSDSQLTIESGMLDLLEDGDVVLADKGFPEVRRIVDESGKKVLVVMPPFLEKKSEFTKEECDETYSIARVRIHVEMIMQRLRTYQILKKIPRRLFNYIDDIVHVCCVLVNLQPPIISDKIEEEEEEYDDEDEIQLNSI